MFLLLLKEVLFCEECGEVMSCFESFVKREKRRFLDSDTLASKESPWSLELHSD